MFAPVVCSAVEQLLVQLLLPADRSRSVSGDASLRAALQEQEQQSLLIALNSILNVFELQVCHHHTRHPACC
jgi:hypothetical protein